MSTTAESKLFSGYPKIYMAMMEMPWKFKDPSQYEQMQQELTNLINSTAKLPFLVRDIELAIEGSLDSRSSFVMQHKYGLMTALGNPKSDQQIGLIAPRADGGVGLHKSIIHRMRIRGLHNLFSYQRENSIAGLSFNP